MTDGGHNVLGTGRQAPIKKTGKQGGDGEWMGRQPAAGSEGAAVAWGSDPSPAASGSRNRTFPDNQTSSNKPVCPGRCWCEGGCSSALPVSRRPRKLSSSSGDKASGKRDDKGSFLACWVRPRRREGSSGTVPGPQRVRVQRAVHSSGGEPFPRASTRSVVGVA